MQEDKLYYSISETAKKMGVEVSTIRYWENQFNILKPKKNKRGVRLFTRDDLDNIQVIYHLLKEKKMTIEGAKEHLKNYKKETFHKIELLTRLENIHNLLNNIKKHIQCTE